MRAFGPAEGSSAIVAALKPFSSRLFSAVELSWIAPAAQWWLVTTRPCGDTKLAVQLPSETTAPIGSPVRSASCFGSSFRPAFFSGPAISGNCCGTHMPSPALASCAVPRVAAAMPAANIVLRNVIVMFPSVDRWSVGRWRGRTFLRMDHSAGRLISFSRCGAG